MKCLLFILALYYPLSSLALTDRHQVSLGSNGLGLSGAYEQMKTNSGSPFSQVDFSLQNISLNYAYRFSTRWQIGGFYQSNHSRYDFKGDSDSFVSQDLTVYGLFSLYNFKDDLPNSFYLGLGLSTFTLEEEISHGISEAESKAPFELDDTGFTYEILLGKRFKIFDHFSYAPSLSIFYRSHGRDFNDQDIDDGVGISIQAIKFDLLF